MRDHLFVIQLKSVLEETGQLLVAKWDFDPDEHEQYIEKIIQRFKNNYISDGYCSSSPHPFAKIKRTRHDLSAPSLNCNEKCATVPSL